MAPSGVIESLGFDLLRPCAVFLVLVLLTFPSVTAVAVAAAAVAAAAAAHSTCSDFLRL